MELGPGEHVVVGSDDPSEVGSDDPTRPDHPLEDVVVIDPCPDGPVSADGVAPTDATSVLGAAQPAPTDSESPLSVTSSPGTPHVPELTVSTPSPIRPVVTAAPCPPSLQQEPSGSDGLSVVDEEESLDMDDIAGPDSAGNGKQLLWDNPAVFRTDTCS